LTVDVLHKGFKTSFEVNQIPCNITKNILVLEVMYCEGSSFLCYRVFDLCSTKLLYNGILEETSKRKEYVN